MLKATNLRLIGAVLALFGMLSINTTKLFAAQDRQQKEAIILKQAEKFDPGKFDEVRAKILLLQDTPQEVRLKRIVALLDISKLRTAPEKWRALERLGVSRRERIVNQQAVSAAMIAGEEKVLWTRPVTPVVALGPFHGINEHPDGSAAVRKIDDPQTFEEAEDYAIAELANAEALQAELEASYDEVDQWVSENGGLVCADARPVESPDGGGTHSLTSDCVDKGWQALAGVVSGIWAVDNYKDVIRQGMNILNAAIGDIQSRFLAGTLTAAAVLEAVAVAVLEFIAGLNLGWFIAGAVIALSGVFVYGWAHCAYPWIFSPSPATYEDPRLVAQ